MIEENKVLTRKSFSLLVMNKKITNPDISTIDAVLSICEEREIDPADIKKLVDPTVKGLIEKEAIELNMIEGSKASLDGLLNDAV